MVLIIEYIEYYQIDENIAVHTEALQKYGVDEAVVDWYAEGLLYQFDSSATYEQTGRKTFLQVKCCVYCPVTSTTN